MDDKNVGLEIVERVATLTIRRPEVKNAIDLATMDELDRSVAALETDRSLQAVILTGAGGTFVSGGDLKSLERLEGIEAGRAMSRRMQAVLQRLEGLEVPVIAAIEGHALGGGAEVALACDIRIAASDARIGFKQIALGIMVGWGGGQRLRALVGRGRALELLLTGDIFSGEEAFRLGLVDRVTPPGQALVEAEALARRVAAQPPLAVRAIKRALYQGEGMPRDHGIAFEAECFARLWGSRDHGEAVKAYFEKRDPLFRGE
ncbi:MAG TPA: enoyl-CoA hydratase/isomerase family protein [Candidatus Methylomirabilis sp.]|nr:enoyl-CoA hydratase/isomerase family protein [Candidatus Methylomirabilis sp.]